MQWCGYLSSPNRFQVGLSQEKAEKTISNIQSCLESCNKKIAFALFNKTVSRMSWWTIACPPIRPFLRGGFHLLSKANAWGMKKLGFPLGHPMNFRIKKAKARWWIPLDAIRDDLLLWLSLAKNMPMCKPKSLLSASPGMHWRTDAMGTAVGAGWEGGFPQNLWGNCTLRRFPYFGSSFLSKMVNCLGS